MFGPSPIQPALSIQFGEPVHGWLPVAFQADTFQLKLDASDVPVNPLQSLCEALVSTAAGGSGRVLWFLEPAECWFYFESQDGVVELTIAERAGRVEALTTVLRLTGTISSVLVPFYRALKEFATYTYDEPHWPQFDKSQLERLGQVLQGYTAENA